MTQALCACGRPIHDTAYVCLSCTAFLRRHLQDVERIAGDITLTVARLTKVRRRGAAEIEREWYRGEGALYPMPMLVDLDAGAKHDAAAAELVKWARRIAEDRGIGEIIDPKRARPKSPPQPDPDPNIRASGRG